MHPGQRVEAHELEKGGGHVAGLDEAARAVPISKILTETDTAPGGWGGGFSKVSEVVLKLSRLRKEDPNLIAQSATTNLMQLLKISQSTIAQTGYRE